MAMRLLNRPCRSLSRTLSIALRERNKLQTSPFAARGLERGLVRRHHGLAPPADERDQANLHPLQGPATIAREGRLGLAEVSVLFRHASTSTFSVRPHGDLTSEVMHHVTG